MARTKKAHWYLALAGAVALLAIVVPVYWYGTCAFRSGSYGTSYACYLDRLHTLVKQHGPKYGLLYNQYIVGPNRGYSLSHPLMHYVGDAAFKEDPSLSTLQNYLAPYSEALAKNTNYEGFDGFKHGFISSYLETASGTIPDTMRYLCSSAVSIPGNASERECYHTLGHAIMHADDNMVKRSIALCDTAPTENAKEGCYFGVFMEDSFLYDPQYHEGSPRPDATSTSMLGLCGEFAGVKNTICSMFVGASLRNGNGHNLGGSFKECDKLEYPTSCVLRLGEIDIASMSRTTDDANALCATYATGADFDECSKGASLGISEGIGIRPVSIFDKVNNFAHAAYLSFLTL